MGKYNINIDIGVRAMQAFKTVAAINNIGYNGFVYTNLNMLSSETEGFDNITIKGSDFELKFGDMPFYSGNYGVFEELSGQTSTSGSSVFAPPPMISFRRSKNNKITIMDGSDNEVVEHYGKKAWEIRMQGIVVDMEAHDYPTEQVKDLLELFNADEILEVSGLLFEEKKIRSIYVNDIDISGVEGFADTQKYTVSARSIKPVEFSILEQS